MEDEGLNADNAKYVLLPSELYKLRVKYPSVLSFLLLECRRCCQWVPVEVTQHIPDEAPLTDLALKRIKVEVPTSIWEPSRERVRVPHPIAPLPDQHSSSTPAGHAGHYIPNPAYFLCMGTLCSQGDKFLESRLEWLKSLYDACAPDAQKEVSKVDFSDRATLDALRDTVTAKLSDEMDIRRSERLAKAKQRKSFVKSEGSSDDEDTKSLSWVKAAANRIMNEDSMLTSCFCWVVCDWCGKVRRTAQPFPGGAPFVCGLSVVGSCRVSEEDGLAMYSEHYRKNTLQRIGLDTSPPIPLLEDSDLDPLQRNVLQAFGNEPALLEALKGSSCALTEKKKIFSSLKELTSAVRKKATSSSVKKLIVNPSVIRKKREAVIRVIFAEETPAQRSASPSQLDDRPELKNTVKVANADQEVLPPSVNDTDALPVARPDVEVPTEKKDSPPPEELAGVKSAKGKPRRRAGPKPKRDVIYWIQCDKCDKWRIVPAPLSPPSWECSLKPGTTCEDPDDAELVT